MHDVAKAVMAVAFFGSIAVIIKSITGVWEKRLDTQNRTIPSHAVDQRLARIEAAVDAVAVEVERISEAQRFTARLASERDQRHIAPVPPHAKEGRTITPH